MQHGDPGAREAALDPCHGLPGEPDLRHHEEDGASGLQHRLGGLEVHLGLAASGDPVKQHLVARVGLAQDAVQGAALLGQEVRDVRERGAGVQAGGLRGGRCGHEELFGHVCVAVRCGVVRKARRRVLHQEPAGGDELA